MTSSLPPLVLAARAGDLAAFGALVRATQDMAYAVAWQVLRDEQDARDAVQEAYLRAFRRLGDLGDAAAFPGWLRRIVVSQALNRRRGKRPHWLQPEDRAPPVL